VKPDEEAALSLFAQVCPGANLAWQSPTADPPDAVSSDRRVGLEIVRLSPGGDAPSGSPTTRRQHLRLRILSEAQQQFARDTGRRGFRVYVVWRDDDSALWKRDVDVLARELVQVVRDAAPHASKRLASEPAGMENLYRVAFAALSIASHVASVQLSWTPAGPLTWALDGSGSSVVLTGDRPFRTAIDDKNRDLPQWLVSTAERWLLIHLDPSTAIDDDGLVHGPYPFDFDRVFLLDMRERTCREIGQERPPAAR